MMLSKWSRACSSKFNVHYQIGGGKKNLKQKWQWVIEQNSDFLKGEIACMNKFQYWLDIYFELGNLENI